MSDQGSRDDELCCCEYINVQGERSHILACCCDCEALDEAAENLISCRPVPSNLVDNIVTVIVDRCRLPWLNSGAKRLQLDRLIPPVCLPLLLFTSTYGSAQTVISFLLMPSLIYIFHQLWTKATGSRMNDFFFFWGCTSVGFALLTFETVVLSFREVYLWENLTLVTMTVLAVYALHLCRVDPGYARRGKPRSSSSFIRYTRRRDASRGNDEEIHIIDDQEKMEAQAGTETFIEAHTVTWVDSRPIKDGKLDLWCSSCQLEKEPRSGHCTICNWCVRGRDHHCVWINSCVGARNHRSFVVAWLLLVLVGLYGSQLTFTSVCTPEMYLDWFLLPNDCRFVYSDVYNAIAFVTALYTLLSTLVLMVGLVHQCLLIAQNLTMQEFHTASRRGMLRYGLIARNNVNHRGLWRNVTDFWAGRRRLAYDVAQQSV